MLRWSRATDVIRHALARQTASGVCETTSANRSSGRLRGVSRGAIMVEYALLLVAVGVPTVAGVTIAGANMLDQYGKARTAIIQANP